MEIKDKEQEDPESELKLGLESLIEQIACTAAVVDGVIQDISSVIKNSCLTQCRQELRTVVEAKLGEIAYPAQGLPTSEAQQQKCGLSRQSFKSVDASSPF